MSARTLIIGADSLIGGALFERLQSHGRDVVGTTRRIAQADGARIFLDLLSDPASWPALPNCDTVVMCAAVNGFAACRQLPEMSRRVNVEAAETLARRALESGARPVFLSSGAVFDGSRPLVRVDEPVSPQTEYGRQKAEAERRLLALDGAVAIVRLTKVVWPEMPLFRDWREVLAKGEPIRPFSDLQIAPLSENWVSAALQRIVESPWTGICQLSGTEDVTYVDFAQALARELHARPDLVQPWLAREAGVPAEECRAHTTLDNSEARREFGLEPPAAHAMIESLFQQVIQHA